MADDLDTPRKLCSELKFSILLLFVLVSSVISARNAVDQKRDT